MRLQCIPLKGETSIVHPNLMLLLAFLKNKSNMPHYSEHVRLNSKCHERNEALVCHKNNYNSMKNRLGAGKTVWLSENRQRSWSHFRWGQIYFIYFFKLCVLFPVFCFSMGVKILYERQAKSIKRCGRTLTYGDMFGLVYLFPINHFLMSIMLANWGEQADIL